MLHILLMILKIIGIILASMLGLILLLLLVVLFVPIRYRAKVAKTENLINGNLRVSWLFGVVVAHLFLKNKDFSFDVKIFGISFNWIKSIRKKFQKKKGTKKSRINGDNTESEVDSKELLLSNEDLLDINDTSSLSLPETEHEKDSDLTENEEQNLSAAKKNIIVNSLNIVKTIIQKVISVIKTIWSIPQKLISGIKKIRLTINSVCDKINYWKNFLQEKSTKEAIALLKRQLIKLLKHIMPKKLKGNVIYGFEDPCKTGQVLAGISAFYPIYYKHVNICPDFTQNILLGNVELKGRIYVCFLVKTALRVLFDKNIQRILKMIKK